MKKIPALPLAWGGTLLIGLLLVLAVVVLVAGRAIERQAMLIQTDSVPGLINGQAIRSAFSEGFVCALQAAGADTPAKRDAFLERMAELDTRGRAACDDYVRTIHVDPLQDSANYRALLRARDDFLRVRTQFIALVQGGRRDEAQQFLLLQLTPGFDGLIRACDVLIAYNNRTGTIVSAGVMTSIAELRWTVIALIVLALAAALSVTTNLLSRRRAEQALRDSERKFSTAFQASPHSMVISRRADGRIIAANDAFRRHYGLGGQEVVGKTSVEIGVWLSAGEREALLAQMTRDGRVTDFVKERVLPGGKVIHLVSSEPIMLGAEECLLTVGQDITARVNAEEALERSGREFRVIFERAAIGMALVSPEGRPIRCNPALERFLGRRNEELCSMSFAEFTHPDDVERDVHLFRKLAAGELGFYQMEKRYVRKDGVVVWGHLTVSLVRGADGKVAYGIGMVEDVSERQRAALALHESETARRKLEEQLSVAQKLEALGQLAGGVAHDFNNMLAAIMLHLDILKMDVGTSPALQGSLDELIQAARRAAGLTRQLLLFSRGEPVQQQLVDLNEVVEKLLTMLNRLVGSHLTLVHVGAEHPLWLDADPGMLEQVVMNLVVNARDAMPRGGRIVLRVEAAEIDEARARAHADARVGSFVRLTVIDTGCGMSAETQAHIFEPFFTTKPVGKGTGLGLSTVFGIVRQHAGWIEVASAEGRGTSFDVYLPAHAAPGGEHPVEAPAAIALHGRGTILLAEDDEPVRLVTARILRQNGYEVLEAEDGRMAQEILDAKPGEVDLLLTDVVMPGGVMGHELVAGLAAGGHRPKVILMSGHNTQVERAALDAAAAAYLAKPFDADRLLRIVRDTLGDAVMKE